MRLNRNRFEQEIMFASFIAVVLALFLVWNPSTFAQRANSRGP